MCELNPINQTFAYAHATAAYKQMPHAATQALLIYQSRADHAAYLQLISPFT